MLCDSIFSSGMCRVLPTQSEPSVNNTKKTNKVVFFQPHPNALKTRIHNTNKVPYKSFSNHIPSYYCYGLPPPLLLTVFTRRCYPPPFSSPLLLLLLCSFLYFPLQIITSHLALPSARVVEVLIALVKLSVDGGGNRLV